MSTVVAAALIPPPSFHPALADSLRPSRRRSASLSSTTTASSISDTPSFEFSDHDRDQRRQEREQRRLARRKQQEEDFALMEAEARREREELRSRWGEKIQKSDRILEELRMKRLDTQREARERENAKLQNMEEDLQTWRKSRDERRRSIDDLSSTSYSTFSTRSRTLSPSRRVPPPSYVPSYMDNSEKRPTRSRLTSPSASSLTLGDGSLSLGSGSGGADRIPLDSPVSSVSSVSSVSPVPSPLLEPVLKAESPVHVEKPKNYETILTRKEASPSPSPTSPSFSPKVSQSPSTATNPVRKGSVMAMIKQQEAMLIASTGSSANDKVRAALANLPPSVRRRESAKKEAENVKALDTLIKSRSPALHPAGLDSGASSASSLASTPSSSRSNTILEATERRRRRVTTDPNEHVKELSNLLTSKLSPPPARQDRSDEVERLDIAKPVPVPTDQAQRAAPSPAVVPAAKPAAARPLTPKPAQSTSTSAIHSIQRRSNRVSLLVEEQERRQREEAEKKVSPSRAGSVASHVSTRGKLEDLFEGAGRHTSVSRDTPAQSTPIGRLNNSNERLERSDSGAGKIHEYDPLDVATRSKLIPPITASPPIVRKASSSTPSKGSISRRASPLYQQQESASVTPLEENRKDFTHAMPISRQVQAGSQRKVGSVRGPREMPWATKEKAQVEKEQTEVARVYEEKEEKEGLVHVS